MSEGARTAGPLPVSRKASGGFYGWKLLAVFWFILLVNLSFPMAGSSLLITEMARSFRFSREELGFPFSVYFGVIGLSSPLVALLIGRLGIRATLVLGNLSLAVGAVALATIARTPAALVLWFGIVIGFAVASGGNLTTQTAIPRWFVRRRAFAYAVILTASAVGGMLIAPILTAFIRTSPEGWRHGWWLLAALATLAAILAGLFVRERPEDVGQHSDGDSAPVQAAAVASAAPAAPLPFGAIVTRADFWAIILASAAITAAMSLVISHGVANALDAGHSHVETGWALALYAVAGLLGKILVGALGDRFNPAYVWAGLLFPTAIGLLVAAFAIGGTGLYLYALTAGCGLGGVVVGQPATVARRFDVVSFARVASLMFLFQAVAGVFVPTLAGWFFTAEAGYRWSFVLTALGCVLSALLLIGTCRSDRRRAYPA